MATKRFNPKCLPRVAILVGCLHILGSLWNILGSVFTLCDLPDEYHDAIKYSTILSLFIAVLFGLAGLFLIIGTWKKLHLMFLPWLIIEGISLIFYFVWNAMRLISLTTFDWGNFAVIMVTYSLIALCVYVWFGILEFYQNIRDEKRKPIADDEEKLCIDKNPYVIPVAFPDMKKPLSLVRY